MTGPAGPTVLVSHTVSGGYWAPGEALLGRLRERLPDADLRVAGTPEETAAMAPDAEVLLAAYVPADLLSAATALRWIQAISSGVDFLDLGTIEDRGIALTNAAGVHAEPIAEQVIGYLLAFERNIHRGIRQQRRGVWERYEGGELRGKTVGVVGLGAIGGRVAEYASTFGMDVVGTKRDPGEAPAAADEVYGPDGLEEVLGRADYLVVAVPLTPETRGLIGRRELGVLGRDAVLVNVGRGEVVDEGALTETLQQRGIRGAALDVFEEEPLPPDSPLWGLSNVIVTPHMAGSTPEKAGRLAELFVDNYEAFVEEGPDALENRVV